MKVISQECLQQHTVGQSGGVPVRQIDEENRGSDSNHSAGVYLGANHDS